MVTIVYCDLCLWIMRLAFSIKAFVVKAGLFNRQSGSFGRPNCAVYSLCVMGLNSNGICSLTVPSNVNSNIFFLNQFIYLLLFFSYLLSSCSDGWLRLGGASIFNQSYCVFIMKLVLQCVMLKNIKTSKNLI